MPSCPVCAGDHVRSECPEAVPTLSPGHRLDDKYVIVRHISTGGMGAVYEVEHQLLGKRLAAKLLLPELARRPELLERFRREARAASATGHENIVEVTDLGQTSSKVPFLIMELLTGRTLGAELKAGRLQPERAVHVTRQILSALKAAHARGIVHRDLKPENVFLIQRAGDPDFVKVLDFGIAKMLDQVPERELTQAGQVVGTPTYMAPEQARGDPAIDARADLYATGAILYRMLTGHRPFVGNNFNALLFAIAQGNPTRPSQHAPEVSVELEQVILKAMAIVPAERFQNAGEFDEALALEDKTGERTRARSVPLAPASESSPSTPGWDMRSVTMVGHGAQPGRIRRVLSRAAQAAIAAGMIVVLGGGTYVVWRRVAHARAESELHAEAERARRRAEEAAEAAKRARPDLLALTLDVEPANARVTLDGAPVPGFEISVARDGLKHVLRVESDGFTTEERPFLASADQKISVKLKKRRPPRPKGMPAPSPGDDFDPNQVKTLEKLIHKLGEEADF